MPLAKSLLDGVYEYLVKPVLQQFASIPFASVCHEFVREMQKKNALPFRYAKMGRWMGKTTVRDETMPKGVRIAESEIDLLCISADAKQYLLGECKWKTSPFSYSEYLDTLAKLASLKKTAKFYYALFSESGFDKKIMAEATKKNTMLYTLEEMIAEFPL